MAIRYATELAWLIIPLFGIRADRQCECSNIACKSPGKHPRINNWPTEATADPRRIEGWWEQWPNANIGIATGPSGLIVVDMDRRNDGSKSLDDLAREHGTAWAETAKARSGNGGHLYFRRPADLSIGNTAGTLGKGLDTRADGGYIVAPPSRHHSGAVYEWSEGRDPFTRPPLEAPAFLLQQACRQLPDLSLAAAIDTPPVTLNAKKLKIWRGEGFAEDRSKGLYAIGETLLAAGVPAARIPRELADRDEALGWSKYRDRPAEYQRIVEKLLTRPQANPFRFLRLDELGAANTLSWTIDGVMPDASLGVLFGAPGTGKTFVALSMGLSISSGRAWFGHQVTKGGVAYVYAEGRGIGARAQAWAGRHGIDIGDIRFLARPMNMLNESVVQGVMAALQAFEDLKLVVFDTLARSMSGNENNTEDMNALFDACDPIRFNLGASVWFVHHTGKDGANYRGSSVIEASPDTMVRLTSSGGHHIRLVCAKQRDADPFDTVNVCLEPRDSSLVAVVDGAAPSRRQSTSDEDAILRVLAAAGAQGLSYSEWFKATGLKKTHFDAGRKALGGKGLVTKGEGKMSHWIAISALISEHMYDYVQLD